MRKPNPISKRVCVEDCQYGDVVEWAAPPMVRDGPVSTTAPSAVGMATMFVGGRPPSVFCRFYTAGWHDGREPDTEPIQVINGQPFERMLVARQ